MLDYKLVPWDKIFKAHVVQYKRWENMPKNDNDNAGLYFNIFLTGKAWIFLIPYYSLVEIKLCMMR